MAMILSLTRLRLTAAKYFGRPPSVGAGTVTAVSAGTGMTNTPNPIIGAGSVALTVPVTVPHGGSGAISLTGYLKGTGVTPFTTQASPIPVADGGTGAVLAPADKSIVYVAGGAYTGDVSNLNYDAANKFVGVGVATPLAPIDVKGSATATPTGSALNLRAKAPGDPAILQFADDLGNPTRGSIHAGVTTAIFSPAIGGNVGINSPLAVNAAFPNPGVTLDVAGPMATRFANLILVNGLNSNIALPPYGYLRITGPTGAFSVGGFSGGQDGMRLTLYSSVSQTMTIVNEDALSVASNRIHTLTGGNLVLAAGSPSIVEFVWDISDQRWILVENGASTGFLRQDGTVPLTANWNAGNFRIDSRNSQNVFNVLAYGAVGDNATDDTAAIQAAINAAAAVSAGTVIFPCNGTTTGTYRTTAPLVGANYVRLVGLSFAGGAGIGAGLGAIIRGEHTGIGVLNLIDKRAMVFENLKFWGDAATTPKTGIVLGRSSPTGAGFHTFRNVAVDGSFTQAAVYSISSEENVWDRCFIRTLAGTAIHAFYTSASDDLALGGGLTTQSNLQGFYFGMECDVRTAGATTDAFYIKLDTGVQGHVYLGGALFANNGKYVTVETNGTPNGGISFINVSGENTGTPIAGFDLTATGGAAKTLRGLLLQNCPLVGMVADYIKQGATLTISDSYIKTQTPAGVANTIVPSLITNSFFDLGDAATPPTFYQGTNGGLEVRRDLNNTTEHRIKNVTVGTASQARLQAISDTALGIFSVQSSTYTGTGAAQANAVQVRGTGAGGLSVGADAGAIRFYTGGSAAADLRGTIDATGIVNFSNIPTYANNAAAAGAGLAVGSLFKVNVAGECAVHVVI